MTPILEAILRSLDPGFVTEVFFWLVAGWFGFSVYWLRYGDHPALTALAPTLLASLGILGTFVGIVVGLLDFDPTQLDESIEGLLGGLKTAFISSIVGLTGSLLFRALAPQLRDNLPADHSEAGPEQVVALLEANRRLLQDTRDAIAGKEESSLAGQLTLLRTGLSDGHREGLQKRQQFEGQLWSQLSEVAKTLSRSATEQVIEALRQVIVDFNNNLTEQFGQNFKRLDDSVQRLVEWQEGYRQQLEELHELYSQSVKQIKTIETSVAEIAKRCESIPEAMAKLTDTVTTASREVDELASHLQAFKDLRDRAVAAIPQAQAHVETMTERVGEAVRVAADRFATMHETAEAQFQASREGLMKLESAGTELQLAIQKVQDRVAAAMENVGTLTAEQMERTVSNTEDILKRQQKALNDAQAEALREVIQEMGLALAKIAGKFTDDYTRLVDAMKRIVRTGTGTSG